MQAFYSFAVFCALLAVFGNAQRLAGECAMTCNDLRTEVLTLEMCREAKRTLPKPKVGDFCSVAMEQGFSDVCVPLCMSQKPAVRVAQACRAAAIEMPRPTVRRWCEHGYTKAYEKAMKDLKSHFTIETQTNQATENIVSMATASGDPHFRPKAHAYQPLEPLEPLKDVTANFHEKMEKVGEKLTPVAPAVEETAVENKQPVIATIPITIDDVTKDLIVYQGQNAEEAVVAFCKTNVPADVPSCIRQLLTVVLEKMEELVVEQEKEAEGEAASPAAEAQAFEEAVVDVEEDLAEKVAADNALRGGSDAAI